jgi:hypothetical protein
MFDVPSGAGDEPERDQRGAADHGDGVSLAAERKLLAQRAEQLVCHLSAILNQDVSHLT